jgi:TPP-dependent pyruvate/acetoin dehydrogenase alpha subunit
MIPAMSRQGCLESFRKMLLIRRFEEACIQAAHENQVPGHYHVYIGQEATAVGVMATLEPGDFVFSTHRNHGHLLARGADPKKALAEIFGKATGYAGGKAGTLHGCAPDLNFPLSSAIVGGILPIAAGASYALKHRRQSNVCVAMFGEGAMEEGAAYEALNLASLWKLPVMFVCENNTAEVERTPGGTGYHAPNLAILELTNLAKTMGLATECVDGVDLGAVWHVAREARGRAVSGGGASFIEVRTVTWPGGQWPTLVTGITDLSQAWSGEIPKQYAHLKAWFERNDPVLGVARDLLMIGVAERGELGELDAAVRHEIDEAVAFANKSPFPDAEAALTHVWPQ